jgi:phosphatidylserine/phosphatidylglycerophosphate/cardiolipin synthase-like enzyme
MALVRARDRGVVVRIIADGRQARGKRSAIPLLRSAGVDVRIFRGRGVMHQKFAIFDGRLLVTGSYNWTEAAEKRNLENALFLDDPALVGRYGEWFDRQFAGAAAITPTPR